MRMPSLMLGYRARARGRGSIMLARGRGREQCGRIKGSSRGSHPGKASLIQRHLCRYTDGDRDRKGMIGAMDRGRRRGNYRG